MEDFKFPISIQLRLDWSEMDQLGHINNVMYFKYLQAARIAYGDAIGLQPETSTGDGYILAATQCRFVKPLYYPGNVLIRSSVEFMKRTSIGLYHQLINDQQEIVAEGHDVVVLFNFMRQAKIKISEAIRAKVEALEERKYPADFKA